MSKKLATKNELRGLFARWNMWAVEGDDERTIRLAWTSRNLGRDVKSWSELTSEEVRSLADVLRLGLELVP